MARQQQMTKAEVEQCLPDEAAAAGPSNDEPDNDTLSEGAPQADKITASQQAAAELLLSRRGGL